MIFFCIQVAGIHLTDHRRLVIHIFEVVKKMMITGIIIITIELYFKHKIVSLTLLSCWFGLGSHAQTAENGRQLFNNDSIKFELLWISPSVESMAKKTKTGTFVELYLPKYVKDSLLKNDRKFWIDHLVADSTDWATNLVLYYLHQRDAKLIQMLYPNRENWLSEKAREISYWSNFLSKHGHKK